MNKHDIQKLSAEAFNELRKIVKEEIKEPMTHTEIQDMGISLLQLFSIVRVPESKPTRIALTQQEKMAYDYIVAELKQGRQPTVRGMAKAAGFSSSKTGVRLKDALVAKRWIKNASE